MNIINRLKELRDDFAYDYFWGGGNAGRALLAESVEHAGRDIRDGLVRLAEAIEKRPVYERALEKTQAEQESKSIKALQDKK